MTDKQKNIQSTISAHAEKIAYAIAAGKDIRITPYYNSCKIQIISMRPIDK